MRQRVNTRLASYFSPELSGPDTRAESGFGWPASPVSCPKRVILLSRSPFVNTEGPASYGRNDEESSRLTAKLQRARECEWELRQDDHQRELRRPNPWRRHRNPKQSSTSREASPAPARRRETYCAIKEMRSQLPAPLDTMGCDTAKWKEIDSRVRD